jgi:hypothetical protein
LRHLRNPIDYLSLRGQCPASHKSSQSQPLREALLGAECNGCFCLLLGCLRFATEVMDQRSKD